MSSETPNTSTSKLTEAEQLVEAWAEEFCAAAGTWWEAKELVKKVADKVEWKRQIFDPDLWYAVNEAFVCRAAVHRRSAVDKLANA